MTPGQKALVFRALFPGANGLDRTTILDIVDFITKTNANQRAEIQAALQARKNTIQDGLPATVAAQTATATAQLDEVTATAVDLGITLT